MSAILHGVPTCKDYGDGCGYYAAFTFLDGVGIGYGTSYGVPYGSGAGRDPASEDGDGCGDDFSDGWGAGLGATRFGYITGAGSGDTDEEGGVAR